MRVVVGLGSNVGDRLETLHAAARRVADLGAAVGSAVYATSPVGGPPQGEFLNAALLVTYEGSARELLEALHRIERDLGRVREERWGPRTIDLDILWIEGVVIDEPDLGVPHPRLSERAFALAPLLDVAPDARDPRTGERYVAREDSGVRRTASVLGPFVRAPSGTPRGRTSPAC